MAQVPAKARQYFLPKLAGIDCLATRTFDVPKPKQHQVLVKIHAVSLNFRDLMIATGQYLGGSHENLVPCSDGAGEVVAVGEDVKKWRVGDRVSANFAVDHIAGETNPQIQQTALGGTIDGTLTEYQLFPDYSLVRIPDHLSYEEAATLPCAALTAWNALHGPVPVKAGDYVLVQGTGGVSMFALQLAVASGAIVIATSSSNEKLAKAKQLGAKYLINYKETPDWDHEVQKITNNEGVHHVVEVGGPSTIYKSLNSLRMGGWIHVIGFLGGNNVPDDIPLTLKILFKDANVRGILVGSRTMYEEMNRALAARDIKPVVDKVFPFDEAAAAYKHLESQKHMGKVVIRVASN
ncbi:hypothetical protein NM688_g8310 [Phlebia brevispora]|uniref:Uncharacterized protein n=1 Tax=Phlebia brevispora TaxID=194682 RepID=A0ACC1RST7_9APHY|nr:hypothetical protein NM688_g8310 [Phlebia brevispora]